MINGRELFAEISNEAISEDGEAVGYFVKNSRMELLERLLTAPPAPAVPDEATAENVEALSGYVSTYKMTESERDIAVEVWNACRAAMLAQSVSGGYTLNSPVIPDGWIACSERMPTPFVDVIASDGKQTICAHVIEDRWWCIVSETAEEPGPIIFWMPLPAAPEGGNG